MEPKTVNTKRPGRPKLGNKLFARRLSPAQIAAAEKAILEAKAPALPIGSDLKPATALESLKEGITQTEAALADIGQMKALLDDIDNITRQRDDWKATYEAAMEKVESEQAAYWQAKYLEVAARVKQLEDQA